MLRLVGCNLVIKYICDAPTYECQKAERCVNKPQGKTKPTFIRHKLVKSRPGAIHVAIPATFCTYTSPVI